MTEEPLGLEQLDRHARADCLRFAVDAVERSGALVRPHFRNLRTVDNKLDDGDYDPVTVADREAEAFLREQIELRYPEHGILGEEFGEKRGNGLTWVLDPIDGTRSFVTGFHHWGTLMALFNGRETLLGVLGQPVLRELFYGDGESAHYRHADAGEVRLRRRECPSLSAAVVGTTHPGCFPGPGEWEAFETLADQCQMLRFGGDCYGYALVAMGQMDLVVEAGLNAYDIQALIPIVRGAGGVMTSWTGDDPSRGGRVVAAGDARVHAQAVEVLQRSMRSSEA